MIITYNDLQKIRAEYKDKRIVLALGAFDLFHYEHMRCLLDAKKQGDILVVSVKCDKFVHVKGPDRPVICQEQRAFMIDNVKGVDYTLIADKSCDKSLWANLSENALQSEWFEQFYLVFDKLRPNALYFEIKPELKTAREKLSKIFNFELIPRQRTAIVTTTKIIDKIRGKCDGNN